MRKQVVNEIIVHAGLHKTATSSIQSSLSNIKNELSLTRKNYLYPKEWPINHSIPVYSAFCDCPEAYHINVRQKLSRNQVEEINGVYLRNIEREIASKRPKKLIISGEDISVLDIQGLSSFKDYLSSTFNSDAIKAVLYVRNPISLSISKVQEDIKAGQHTLKSVIKNIRLDSKEHSIKQRIEDVEKVFGKGLTEVYPFEKALEHTQGPVGHFLSIIGFNKDEIAKFYIEKSNESLSQLAANMISFINEKYPLFEDGAIKAPRENGDTLPITKIKGMKFDLTFEQKKELRDKYNDEIVWLRDHFGIDYSATIKKSKVEKKCVIFSDQILQIKEAYAKTSNMIQGLIIEYLKGIVNKDIEINHNKLQALIVDLEKSVTAEKRFRNNLHIDDAIDSAEIYREIALVLESYDEIDTALTLMNKALEIRPNGPFIRKKIKEYEKSVRKNSQ